MIVKNSKNLGLEIKDYDTTLDMHLERLVWENGFVVLKELDTY